MMAMLVGTALAIVTLCFVLYPLFREPLGIQTRRAAVAPEVGVSTAVDALREIEFDHVTGKLSDKDYAELKSAYTQTAVAAMRERDDGEPTDHGSDLICARCGPRPERDAVYCSECGQALAA
ncbi:MAG TPA: hypothetical protein VIC03_13200 [Gemmatimonadaceae bacterium]|jgi:hypothetical protein